MVFTVRFILGLVLLLSACVQIPASRHLAKRAPSTPATPIRNETVPQTVDDETDEPDDVTATNEPKTETNHDVTTDSRVDKTESHTSTTDDHIQVTTTEEPEPIEQTPTTSERTKDVESTGKTVKQTTFRNDNGRSLGMDISKYISPEFHNQNNVYTLPLSQETMKYVSYDVDYKTTSKPPDFTNYEVTVDLTTPRNDFFDAKYREVQEKVTQGLEEYDRYAKYQFEHETDTSERPTSSASVDDNYKKYRRLEANESKDKNKIHRDYTVEESVKVDFASVYNDTFVDSNKIIVAGDRPKFDDELPGDLDNEESKKVHEAEPARDVEKFYKTTTKKPASPRKDDAEVEKLSNGKVTAKSFEDASLDVELDGDYEQSRENAITVYKRGSTKTAKVSPSEEIATRRVVHTTTSDEVYKASVETTSAYESTTLETTTLSAVVNSSEETAPPDVTTTEMYTTIAVEVSTQIDRTTPEPTEDTSTITSSETETTEKMETTQEECTTESKDATSQATTLVTDDETKYFTVTDEKPQYTMYEATEITTTTELSDITSLQTNPQRDTATRTPKSKFNVTAVEHLNEIERNDENVTTIRTVTMVGIDVDQQRQNVTTIRTVTTVGTDVDQQRQNVTLNITANEIENVISKENATIGENDIVKQDQKGHEPVSKPTEEPPSNDVSKDNATNSHDADEDIEENDDEYGEINVVKHNQNQVASDPEVEPNGDPSVHVDVSKTSRKSETSPTSTTQTSRRFVVTIPLEMDEDVETTTIGDNQSLTGDEDNGGKIAAIVISTVGAVCLLLLAALLVLMRKRQKRFNYGQQCRPVSLDAYSMDNVSIHNSARRKGVLMISKRSYGNQAFEDPHSTSHALNFTDLVKFAGNVEGIRSEFEDIPQVTTRTNELPEGCEVKNRYANVIPLPETRVFLKTIEGYPNSDYINANFVTGPKNTRGYYIACQAPLSNTIEDFWRMLWEQQCKVVLMLTHLYENGIEKCIDYLPPSEVLDCHRLFGDYQVTLKKREVKDKYIISSLQLKNMVSNSWREVTHLWYLEWPEKGVPDEANSLIAFLIEARSFMKSSDNKAKDATNGNAGNRANSDVSPVVVHCSPGTGRTGTVLACDIAIREFELTRHVDIPKIVSRIRRDRASSVQTKEQYAFIYKVINVYATTLTGGAFDSF